jgi:sortase (surface protein transpeptidase)
MRPLGVVAAGAVLATVAIAGCGRAAEPARASGTTTASAGTATHTAGDPAAGFRSPRTHPTVALPTRLRIPAIGVDTSLLQLGLDAHGAVEPPAPYQEAGWYTGSVRPGQAGPAVLLGHVDSKSAPGVFFRLAQLRPGDRVEVTRADGSRVTFRVSGKMQVAKSRFPTDLVYGPTLRPSLHLVTCGGTFDKTVRHYRDNVIVTAVPS